MRAVDIAALLTDGFGRVHEGVHGALDGVPDDALTWRSDPDANTMAWTAWHLTRVQDDHVAHVAGHEQLWTAGRFAQRFALPFDEDATGWGQDSDEVGQVRVGRELLLDYYDAVHEQTLRYLGGLSAADLDRVVDTRWDPPVTLGVRLVSVLDDDMQHVGQLGYIRGCFERQA